MRSLPTLVRLAIVWFIVVGVLVACGSGDSSTFTGPGTDDDSGVGPGSSGGFMPGTGGAEGGAPTNTNCKKLTCADQKIECGPAGDGCGGLIAECGKCGPGLRCGGPNALSKCVSPSIGTACTPKTCAQLNIGCGLAGDGCGGMLSCGTCGPGMQCGKTGTPSQCVAAVPLTDGGACVAKTCADYLLENKDCGKQSDNCGGTIDCGGCADPEFCGGGGPSKCAVSGGGVCIPKTCADYPGKCGKQPNGCSGLTDDCMPGGCPAPQVCGGGGTPSVCGGGSLVGPGGGPCVPKSSCGPNECGTFADGCGGVFDCGTANCSAVGKVCGGAGVPNQCGTPPCVKLVACPAGSNCGEVADNCGGTISCGPSCVAPAICGGGGVPNKCGGGVVVGPGGGACVPLKVCPAGACGPIADGCGGVLACGGCVSPALCGGGGTPSVCGGGNQCTPKTKAVACGTTNCGYAADGCGGAYTCGLNNTPDCPTGQSCGLYAPNQCGSLSGPCIATGSATKCSQNSDCCSGSCGATGTCLAVACKNLAVACASGNECCSGKCTGGLCVSNNPTGCKASGSTCGADSECCSMGCIGGKCASTTSYCKQNGDSCTASTQCCGGSCVGATATQAGYCGTVAAPGGGTTCTIAGTVVACSSTTDYACNAGCCSGSCGPNAAAPGYQICQSPAACAVQGELCTKNDDCCGYPTAGSLVCSKPGQVCKTAADACSFPNNCCEPADIANAGGGNCNSNPDACCRHDNLGIPRCTRYAVCRTAGQTCETPADCCPINGEQPPCSPDGAGVYHCGASCLANNAVCTVDKDCCGGNCYKATAGAATGVCKIPTCTKKTCADYPTKNCGQLSDGCGGIALAADGVTASCGSCTYPETCGGSGTANVCGGKICTANTCDGLKAECGTIPDGCGNVLTCPACVTGTCGGGGVANKCGSPTCTPLTCAANQCGQTGDGCGNILTCGTCPDGQTCGGGGVANRCGAPACVPIVTCPAGKNCGDYPNGCGGSIHCGDCGPGLNCGGGGAPNVCGKATCAAKSCVQQGAQCGSISDQCGGVLTCGNCGPNEFCNGQNLCVGLACTPKTCTQLNVQCGPTANGCGGLIDCGNCPAGTGCGAGGVPGKCGTNPCKPLTCSELGAMCGTVADGCGGLTPDCGTCAGTLSCKNGACVTACTPTTCAAAGAQCGSIADGCGGSLNCGPCPDGETCGYNSIANKCGKDMPK